MAQSKSQDILGIWANPPADAHIEIFEENGRYFGKVVWLKDPLDPQGNPKKDKNNPKASLRTREILGITLLHDLQYKGGKYSGGSIYTPERGMELSCKAQMTSAQELKLTVSKGIFSKNVIWTRVD